MPISILSKIPGQPNPPSASHPTKSPSRLPISSVAKKDSRPDCDVFNNGQRLVVVIGSEKRMIKII